MTTGRRRLLVASQSVLCGAVIVLVLGFAISVAAQTYNSQDYTNAMLMERQNALSARLDKIETLLQYGMVGLVGNLVAHIFQIQTMRKKD